MKKPSLKTTEWLELETIVTAFEKALRQPQRPVLHEFMVGCQMDPVTLLLELIASEVEHRSLLGERFTQGDYLQAYADLLASEEDQLRLAAVFDEVQTGILSARNTSQANALSHYSERPATAPPKSRERYQWIERISPGSSRSSEH